MADRLIKALGPFWLIGAGALAGLLMLVILWGILAVVHRRSAQMLLEIARERVVFPVLVVAVALGLYTIIITLADVTGARFFDQKLAAVKSVFRLPFVGARVFSVDVGAKTDDLAVPLNVRDGELKSIELGSELPLTIALNVPKTRNEELKSESLVQLVGDPFKWNRPRDPSGPWSGKVTTLYVTNESDSPAKLSVKLETQPVVPEASVIPYTAFGLVAYVGFFFLLQLLFPRIAAVALTTGKEAVSQPLFYLVMAIGCVLFFLGIFTPYFTFGEDIKMYKIAGFDIIMILSIFMALWTASVSISEEIEGRTALTVLSKPITRQHFILGKYLGIVSAVALMFILLGTLFVICVSYKVMYDARENVDVYIGWQDAHLELVRTVPGLVLRFLETIVLAAISVAISTRLPMLANLIICIAIYVVGHLVPLFVQSSFGQFPIVEFMAQLTAVLLPVLEHYNIYAAVVDGRDVPLSYLGMVGAYSAIYITIAMLFALLLFDDRDLA